ncbi:sensor histidine kinase [Pontiella agarivorans]|uniref:histidine kinase n=1 Tax=Pontiella agarivorans TaxID=3038953 RepID=A0ABU5MXZ5_9BACT|nr:sensor histidine kinase [Pontiella agarivorans]MDZ8119042.1 sensor histidine kinase [Pontiella agarivorans]
MSEKTGLMNKTRLALMLGLVLLAGFMTMSIAGYYVSKANIREAVRNHELPLASDNIHSEIQRILLPPLNISETMANSVFLRDWVLDGEQDVERIIDYLSRIQSKQGMTSAFLVSEKTRNYYSHKGLRNQIDPEGEDVWYARCRDARTDFEINADIDMHVSNRLTLFINYKVYDYDGNFIGVAGVAERIESIEALIQHFKSRYRKTIYFANPDGRVAYSVGEDIDPLSKPMLSEYLASKQLAGRILSQPSTQLEYSRNGRNLLLNARYLPELGWYLLVEEDVDMSTAHLKGILAANLSVCIVLTALVLAVVYLAGQQYQRRLLGQHEQVLLMADELEGRNDELERLHHEKDEFMKIVVHDLKTPLSGMIGMARLIHDESDLTIVYDLAKRCEEAGEDMIALIQNLLNLKSLESPVLPPVEPLDLNDVLDAVWADCETHAQSKAIRMNKDTGFGSIMIHASAPWAQSILENLVSNAIKFSPEGSVVTVRVVSSKSLVRIWVEDQGPGILPEELGRLFQQFSRLSSRPTGGERSSGLGLYVVKTMADKLGGRVGVESEPGSGSRFWVEFPLG